MQAGHLQPLTEEMFLYTGLCLEDGQWNSSDGEKHKADGVKPKDFYFGECYTNHNWTCSFVYQKVVGGNLVLLYILTS